MSVPASDWIAAAGIVLGGGGGGTVIVKLTRLVTAVEGLIKTVETTVTDMKGLSAAQQGQATQLALHEQRLASHDSQIATLHAVQQAVQQVKP